jgi:GNAT superfamily N-acetyltransferase
MVFQEWKGDISFITSSWINSYVTESNLCRGVQKSLARREHSRIVNLILSRGAVVIAATDREAPDLIYGYAVFQPSAAECALLHYVYVKASFRKFGLGTRLVEIVRASAHRSEHLPMVTDHDTRNAGFLKKCGVMYNPFLMLWSDHENRITETGQCNSRRDETPERILL